MNTERRGQGRRDNIDWSEVHRRLERFRHAVEGLNDNAPERQEQILRERAAGLAKAPADAAPALPPEQSIEVLVFQAAGERYAFDTAHVDQVHPMLPITALPGVPDFVVGIILVEGEALSVLDLRSLLDLPLSRLAEPAAIIVLRNETMEFGVLAEEILGIERHAEAALERALPTLADTAATYLKGVAMDRTAILDAELLLSDPRLVVETA